MNLEQIKREKAKIQRKLLSNMEKAKSYRDSNACLFFEPYRWQKDRVLSRIEGKNTIVITSSNKIGKTALGVNIVNSWAMGFEPWNEVDKDYPEAVPFRKKWYKPSSLGIKPPVRGVITGEDWKMHIGETIVREMKKWLMAGTYETKKNEQGIEYLWKFENGSEIVIMCYTQEDALFESSRFQWAWTDEPMPKSKYTALRRALFLDRGKMLMTLTPLKEAWILDELVLEPSPDREIVDQLCITENEVMYKDDCRILSEAGLTKKQIDQFFGLLLYKDKAKNLPVEDRGKKAEAFLIGNIPGAASDRVRSELHLLPFIKAIDPKEVPSRVFGVFKSLVGRVLKVFKPEVHMIEPFPVPTDWPVIALIDFHLNKPQAISFHAVNKQDIKYVIKEIWENLSPEETADAIIRHVESNSLRCGRVQIDPLSKGDTAYMRNRMGDDLQDSFSIISERLEDHGIELEVASKDKDSGIRNLETALTGVNGLPTYFVFNTCPRHLHEVQRWVYDDDGKPKKENDDFMENWYRATLAGLKYEEPRPKSVPYHAREGAMSWMGS